MKKTTSALSALFLTMGCQHPPKAQPDGFSAPFQIKGSVYSDQRRMLCTIPAGSLVQIKHDFNNLNTVYNYSYVPTHATIRVLNGASPLKSQNALLKNDIPATPCRNGGQFPAPYDTFTYDLTPTITANSYGTKVRGYEIGDGSALFEVEIRIDKLETGRDKDRTGHMNTINSSAKVTLLDAWGQPLGQMPVNLSVSTWYAEEFRGGYKKSFMSFSPDIMTRTKAVTVNGHYDVSSSYGYTRIYHRREGSGPRGRFTAQELNDAARNSKRGDYASQYDLFVW